MGYSSVYNNIKHVLRYFQFKGTLVNAVEMSSGNINATYHLTYAEKNGVKHEYTLQKINRYVFKNPQLVMDNISFVTNHLKKRIEAEGLDASRHTLEIVPTLSKEVYHENEQGEVWRAYFFITNATTYDYVQKNEHFFEVGRAFGRFQRLLNDFPVDNLTETIPDFHNTPKRFYDFVATIGRDPVCRVNEVEPEIDFFFDRRKMMGKIVNLIGYHQIPLRVTHNDTKINNVMIDTVTDQAISVIDLDTVMPGSVLYDFGDAIRSGACRAGEDEEDLARVFIDMELFELFTRGFLKETCAYLLPEEVNLLPLGVMVITCELAMRFLTDYIDGDLYFKVKSPTHNLIRARTQIKLLTDIEQKYDQMNGIIQNLI